MLFASAFVIKENRQKLQREITPGANQMIYPMIFLSIFLFGVAAGLILAHIVANRNEGGGNKRLKNWKNQF